MTTLGDRLNNPLNIRYSPMNNWQGQIGEEKGFCKFVNKDYGYRAALVLLRNYVRKGFKNVEQIISRWAPASENATASYIRFVHQDSGICDINYLSDLILVCKSMAKFESGSVVDTDHLVDIALDNYIEL